jgi:predicted dehydrogenase
MIKVAIIGCGKQADAHASQIQRLAGCEIVGVCDKEILMAKQLFERFNVKEYFCHVDELLARSQPDVVHITTPPQSHLELGKMCFEAGCHVFFEKPFALNRNEAESLIKIAEAKNLKLTVGHNNQYNKASIQMRDLVRDGYLGGAPVHMESIWGYDLGDQRFASALLGEKTHWIRGLPGKLLHNIISHGIAKIAEYLASDFPTVMAHGFTSPFLRRINEKGLIDELRVIINDDDCTTAYFTFSTQVKPMIRQFRLYGPNNSLVVDDMHQTMIKITKTDYKSYLNHFVPPVIYAKQYFDRAKENMWSFLKRDLHLESGRKVLIESFYRSISDDTPLPISYKEILVTSWIMDSIFQQIGGE